VVCPACGTRIKAGRGHCLRCFEDLPAPGTPVPPSILVSLGWSRGKQAAVAGAALSAALALLVVIWQTSPETAAKGADPVPGKPRTVPVTAAAAPVSTAAATVGTRPEPARAPNGDEPFLDTPRGPSEGDGTAYQQTWDHFKTGRAAADARQWTRAIEAYGAAARVSPKDAAAQYNYALALHRRGDERDAIATFQKAIALAPDDPAFHVPLGAAFENVGQSADAAREYRAFVTAAPNAPDAERVRGRIEALATGAQTTARDR